MSEHDDLARFLYEHPDCGDSSGQEFYRTLASDIVDFIVENWTDSDMVTVPIADLDVLLNWVCAACVELFSHNLLDTAQPGPVTRRLIEAVEEAEGR